MKVGSARYCLSPTKEEFYLIGYRSENRYDPAKGIHDDIYCNSLLFDDEGQMVFIFSADFIEFEEGMAEEVKTKLHAKFGIERDCVLLCATHNHSSIVSYHKGWYTGKFDQDYYDFLIQVIIDSFEDCQKNAVEAAARYGKKVITGYYGNRNHPGRLADNEVIVVKFYDQQGIPFAGIVNWAVHSTVISADNDWLTSELAGEVSKKLYDSFGFYPAMIVGAAADCSNRNERQGNDFTELARVSDALANVITKIEVKTSIEIESIYCQTMLHTIDHKMEFVHEEIKAEIERLQMKKESEEDPQKKHFMENKAANLAKKLAEKSFHLDVKCTVIMIGEIQLFVFPGELGSKFGIEIKKAYPSLGLIFGYTNGYYGYFLPQEEYGLSFETIGSPIPKGEPEKITQKFIQTSQLLKLNRRKE